MDPYNRPTDMLYRLNTQQLVGLDKHQEMINRALHEQQHTPQIQRDRLARKAEVAQPKNKTISLARNVFVKIINLVTG